MVAQIIRKNSARALTVKQCILSYAYTRNWHSKHSIRHSCNVCQCIPGQWLNQWGEVPIADDAVIIILRTALGFVDLQASYSIAKRCFVFNKHAKKADIAHALGVHATNRRCDYNDKVNSLHNSISEPEGY